MKFVDPKTIGSQHIVCDDDSDTFEALAKMAEEYGCFFTEKKSDGKQVKHYRIMLGKFLESYTLYELRRTLNQKRINDLCGSPVEACITFINKSGAVRRVLVGKIREFASDAESPSKRQPLSYYIRLEVEQTAFRSNASEEPVVLKKHRKPFMTLIKRHKIHEVLSQVYDFEEVK